MDLIEKYESFHDWYLLGVDANSETGLVELRLMFDNKKDRARLLFRGVSRCFVNDFLIQNIIYSVKVLTDVKSDEYQRALDVLDNSYPWGRNKPLKKIASITASLGAELFIEFESVEVEPSQSRTREGLHGNIENLEQLRGWYLDILAVREENRLTLGLKLDDRRATVTFVGTSRCEVGRFGILNIVGEIQVLRPGEPHYDKALAALAKTDRFSEKQGGCIAFVGTAAGAELFVEFDSLEIEST
jgi:hypothetical protein